MLCSRSLSLALILTLGTSGACAPRQVARSAAGTQIAMTPNEAKLVDGLAAREPRARVAGTVVFGIPAPAAKRCTYWKDELGRLPPETPGAHQYVETKGAAACKEVDEAAERTVRAEIMVERKDGRPSTVVFRFLTGKTPLAKALFSLTVGMSNVKGRTEADGSFRADAQAFKAQVYVSGSKDVPYINLSAGNGPDIVNPPEIVALYQNWMADEKSGATKAGADADAEVASAKCSPEREARLVTVREKLASTFNAAGLTIEYPTVRETKIFVATDTGPSVTMSVGAGTDAHMLAIGLDAVKLDAKNQNGVVATETTEYEQLAQKFAGPTTASRRMAAKPGDDLTMTVRGHGCTLVMLLRKF